MASGYSLPQEVLSALTTLWAVTDAPLWLWTSCSRICNKFGPLDMCCLYILARCIVPRRDVVGCLALRLLLSWFYLHRNALDLLSEVLHGEVSSLTEVFCSPRLPSTPHATGALPNLGVRNCFFCCRSSLNIEAQC